MPRKPLLTILIFILMALPATGARAQTPQPTRLEVSLADVRPEVLWYGIYHNGTRVAWQRYKTEIVEQSGTKIVRFTIDEEEKVHVVDSIIDITHTTTVTDFEAIAPFRLLRTSRTVDRDDTRTSVKSVVLALGPAGYEAEMRTGNDVQRRALDSLDFRLADVISLDLWLRQGPQLGRSITTRAFETARLVIGTDRYTFTGRKSRRVLGKDIEILEISQVNSNTKSAWTIESDTDARTVYESNGSWYERRLETEAEAKDTSVAWAPEPTRLEISLEDVRPEVLWYGNYYKGTRTGWTREETALVEQDGKTVVRYTSNREQKVDISGTRGLALTAILYEFEAASPFRLLRASQSVTQDGKTHSNSITLGQAGYETETRIANSVKRLPFETLDYTLADHIGVRLWMRRGPSLGQSITALRLHLDPFGTYSVSTTLKGSKSRRVGAIDSSVLEMYEYYVVQPEIEYRYESDQDGRVIARSERGEFEVRLESEAEAKRTGYGVDLAEPLSVKLNRTLNPLGKLRSVTFKAIGPDLDLWIKSGPHQKVEQNFDGSITITLRKNIAPNLRATETEIADGLAETFAHPINEPRVKALARIVIGSATTDLDKLYRIVAFTGLYLQPSLEFTSVPLLLDVLDRKRGDCKSYSLLVVALAKAAGLPARSVSGLVYMGDGPPRLYPHAWAEVVVEGAWMEVDATRELIEPAMTHLRYGAGSDGHSASGAIHAAGGFRIEALTLEHDP